MAEPGSRIANRYEIQTLIGAGGMGDVFRGLDTETYQLVAIKLLHPEIVEDNPGIVERFEREGEALRRLSHPNIVSILDTVEEDGKHYLIMEYVSGGSLRDLIDEHSRLPLEAVLNIALDLADALTRAHRLKIIHRDIKPDNVLIAEDGTPRLTDFGVAHVGDRTKLTQTGAVIGTYSYLSPEACHGIDLDERTDIWSFGIMLYEMLTGRVPFHENSSAAILTAILTKPAPDPLRLRPGIPLALVDLIAHMLEKDRETRISSIRLVGATLEALIRDLDTPIRQLLIGTVHDPLASSRFATPTDEHDYVPAMVRSDSLDQTHGLSVYPEAHPSTPLPHSTPHTPHAITPGVPVDSGEIILVNPNKWKWIALMVIIPVLACSIVAVFGIIFAPGNSDNAIGEPPTATKLPTAPLTVEAVEPNEYMVLVAELEPLGPEQRNVSRFVVDDLRQTLEISVPYSNIRIRQYPGIITSSEQARAAANANHAAVIVWGNYTPNFAQIDIQVGDTSVFPHNQFERELLERTANVRVQMTDERRESVAHYVLNVLAILHNADGDTFESGRVGAIQNALDVTNAELTGNTVAAHLHRAYLDENVTESLKHLDAALEIDTGNPLLYAFSSSLKQQLGQFEESKSDSLTAQRIGPSNWVLPIMLQASATFDDSVLDLFNSAIEARPDDWQLYFYRGSILYTFGASDAEQYGTPELAQQARADLDTAISMNPQASFPYIYSALLALHEGDLAKAGRMIDIILTEFPNPSIMELMIKATWNDEAMSPYVITLSAFTNQILGRPTTVIEYTTAGKEIIATMADWYLLEGVAQCALDDFAAAEANFSAGLEADPNFVLLHLLRADARLQQADQNGADDDFSAVAESEFGNVFAPYADAIQRGDLGCATFLSPDNPLFKEQSPSEVRAE